MVEKWKQFFYRVYIQSLMQFMQVLDLTRDKQFFYNMDVGLRWKKIKEI